MSGTPLNPARFAGLMATVAKSFPLDLLTDEVCKSWEDNGKELAKRLAFLAQKAPEPKRKRNTKQQSSDEAAFYQNRTGLWVDADLKRYVGLQTRATRGAKALKSPRLLSQNENEATMFGQPGSDQYARTLAYAVDLGQIAELIAAQEGGKPGVLLKNGYANIFPVRGKEGALRVVHVYWYDGKWGVYCDPFMAGHVWNASGQAFSN